MSRPMLLSVAASAVLVVAAVATGLLLTHGSNRGTSAASANVPGQATPATSPPSSALASAPSGPGSGKKPAQHGAKPEVLRSVELRPGPAPVRVPRRDEHGRARGSEPAFGARRGVPRARLVVQRPG